MHWATWLEFCVKLPTTFQATGSGLIEERNQTFGLISFYLICMSEARILKVHELLKIIALLVSIHSDNGCHPWVLAFWVLAWLWPPYQSCWHMSIWLSDSDVFCYIALCLGSCAVGLAIITVAEVWFIAVFACLFICMISQKLMQLESPNLT